MKLESIIHHIRSMRDRDGLKQIINAAESRDSKLGNIESEKERARLWAKVEKLGLQAGDMVFLHTEPQRNDKGVLTSTGQHLKLWAKPLTVKEVKPRSKEIIVRAPGSPVDHRLSPFTCVRLGLSKEPTPEALANALKREDTLAAILNSIRPSMLDTGRRRANERFALNA